VAKTLGGKKFQTEAGAQRGSGYKKQVRLLLRRDWYRHHGLSRGGKKKRLQLVCEKKGIVKISKNEKKPPVSTVGSTYQNKGECPFRQ